MQSNHNAISSNSLHSLYSCLFLYLLTARTKSNRTQSSCLAESWHRAPVNIYINSLRYEHDSAPSIWGLATAVLSVMDIGPPPVEFSLLATPKKYTYKIAIAFLIKI